VQHIVPIQPPSVAVEKQPVLHLTKKELKRQRKLRRQARQRELQDMQAAGLIPAPEPRLTLKNFIQVMGDQAYVDPSKIEQKVQEQMEARQRVHMERNEASKLTKEQRSAKRARKYHEDTSAGVTVAVFYVLDTSHPFLRAKMDLNAQQNNITGGVLECEVPRLSCVICEGGPKAIKRYRRLMEVRMNWTGPGVVASAPTDEAAGDDEGPAHKFNPDNKCELVWQGMAVKRYFKGFVFQACETADQARAVLKSKGVAHYWDQVLEHHRSGGSSSALQLRLAADSASESDPESDSEDVTMKESDA
jgi:U4/U6 small nuclear ribonucleoprotein PRP3